MISLGRYGTEESHARFRKIEEAWAKPRVDDSFLQELVNEWKSFADLFGEVNTNLKVFFRAGAEKTLARYASDQDEVEVEENAAPNPSRR